MTKTRRTIIIRYTVWAVLLLLAFLVQTTNGLALNVGKAHICLIIPIVICISMFEMEKVGCWYGLAAGLLMDIPSPVISGYNALVMLITGTLVGLLVRYLLRNTLLSAIVFCGSSLFLYESFYWLFFVFLKGTAAPNGIYWSNYFSTFLVSMIFVIPIYLIMSFIYKKLSVTEKYTTSIRELM